MNDNEIFYNLSFEYFYNLIDNQYPLKYSRFNDGEFIAMSNPSMNRGNCDGHLYFPKMGESLKNVLINYIPENYYILECFKHWYNTIPLVKNEIDNLKSINNNLCFIPEDFIRISHEQNVDKFKKLLNLLISKNVYLVGADYLKDMGFNFNHISTPLQNAYLELDLIISDIDKIDKNNNNIIFLLSMGLSSGLVIDYFKNSNNIFIDWGSVWDTFFVSNEYNFIKKRSTSNNDELRNSYKEYLI